MAEKTFESQMERLEEIVRLLEKGEAPLNESMKLFEEAPDCPPRSASCSTRRSRGDRHAGEHAGRAA